MDKISNELLEYAKSNDLSIGEICIIIILILFFFAGKYLLSSYSTQKAKNLADKEDIKELTAKVEQVREEFNHRTEQLKANLGLKVQLKFSHKNEIRNAIINMNSAASEYWTVVRDTTAFIENIDDNKSIAKVHFLLEKAMLDYNSAAAQLKLYLADKNLEMIIHDFSKNLLVIEGHSHQYLVNAQAINSLKEVLERKKSTLKSEGFIQEYGQINDKALKYRKDLSEALLINYKGLLDQRENLISALREQLNKLHEIE